VAGYYALYEAEVGVIIAEYQHANPGEYTDTKDVLNLLTTMIDAQAADLKPPVPSGAVVDTKTNKMWTQHFTPNPVDASSFFSALLRIRVQQPASAGASPSVFPYISVSGQTATAAASVRELTPSFSKML
jgi:hypothetical protein